MKSFDDPSCLIKDTVYTEEEQQELLMKLWELLKWQAGKYNGVDSSSMPIEKAQALLASLIYTMSIVAAEDNVPMELLLKMDFHDVIKRGQEILDFKRKKLKEVWERLCLIAPQISNVYYVRTMKNLGVFFNRYEIYYAANDIPCDIDYPLIEPVSDEIKGISYIEEYMKRLALENSFLGRCNLDNAITFFEKVMPAYKEDYFNMSEVIFVNMVGFKLLKTDEQAICLTKQQVSKITALLRCRTGKERQEILYNAANKLCQDIGMEIEHMSYFMKCMNSVISRVNIAINTGDLSNIFLAGKDVE